MCDYHHTDEMSSALFALSIPDMDPMDVSQKMQIMKMQEESSTYRCTDFFAAASSGDDDCTMKEDDNDNDDTEMSSNDSVVVNAECRRKMCEWSFQVVDFCKFRRETVDVAMSLVDRFLSRHCCGSGTTSRKSEACSSASATGSKQSRAAAIATAALSDKRLYQLLCMTALYMAIKLHEPMEMETTLVAELSRGEYTAAEISDMERTILEGLQWRVLCGPSRLTWCLHLLALLPLGQEEKNNAAAAVSSSLLELVRFQTELATCEYSYSQELPSKVAMAICWNAMQVMNMPDAVMQDFGKAVLNCGLNPLDPAIGDIGNRLLQSAAKSEQASFLDAPQNNDNDNDNVVVSSSCSSTTTTTTMSVLDRDVKKKNNEESPVCVSRTAMQQ